MRDQKFEKYEKDFESEFNGSLTVASACSPIWMCRRLRSGRARVACHREEEEEEEEEREGRKF